MAEGRVADIMRQACGGDNGGELVFVEFAEQFAVGRVFVGDGVADSFAEGAAYRGNFEAMRESVVHEDGPGQGEDLGLVLETPEGGGENDAIVVP